MSHNATPCPTIIPERALNFSVATSTIIAVLSPVAVAGNALILATIWKKTFVRTPFHIFLSGLAFTDLCTGLIAQPFYVSPTLMYCMGKPWSSYQNAATYHHIGNREKQCGLLYFRDEPSDSTDVR